jgi:hypothetical protein
MSLMIAWSASVEDARKLHSDPFFCCFFFAHQPAKNFGKWASPLWMVIGPGRIGESILRQSRGCFAQNTPLSIVCHGITVWTSGSACARRSRRAGIAPSNSVAFRNARGRERVTEQIGLGLAKTTNRHAQGYESETNPADLDSVANQIIAERAKKLGSFRKTMNRRMGANKQQGGVRRSGTWRHLACAGSNSRRKLWPPS